jgi:hypothetical protein
LGKNTLRSFFRARATFPATLLAVAVTLGLAGWLVLQWSTPPPPELQNEGRITVYTSDPKARMSLSLEPVPKNDSRHLDPGNWVRLDVEIEGPPDEEFWWVLALHGDAQFPPGFLGPGQSGEVPEGLQPGRGRHYFVNGMESNYSSGGTVIFPGELSRRYSGDSEFDFDINLRKPLVQDAREFVTLSTPTLGRAIQSGVAPPRDQGFEFRTDTEEPGDRKPLLDNLNQRSWYAPERLQVRFDLEIYTATELALQEEGTVPVAAFRKEWQAKNALQVQAVFRRPGETAKNQRVLFFAGVLASLAASFFVWALELLRGSGRDPVDGRTGQIE